MVESINNGMTPQGSTTPDSNCSAKEKEQSAQLLANSVQIDGEALKAKLLIKLSNGEKVGVFDFHRAGGKFAYLDKPVNRHETCGISVWLLQACRYAK